MDVTKTSLTHVSNTRRTGASGGATATSSNKGSFKSMGAPSSSVSIEGMTHLSSIDIAGLFDFAANPDQHKRQGVSYGETLLDRLDQFRTQIAMGSISPDLLKELRDRVNTMPVSQMDPKLRTIVEDIRIRAEVELANLGIGTI